MKQLGRLATSQEERHIASVCGLMHALIAMSSISKYKPTHSTNYMLTLTDIMMLTILAALAWYVVFLAIHML